MKAIKVLAIAGAIWSAVMAGSVNAQTNAPPPVVVDKYKDNIPAELKEIKALVTAFEVKRDAYVAEQKALLAKLKNATTDAQRNVIRGQLQDNRQQFMAELRNFREDLHHELQEIKQIVHSQELKRLLQDADPTATSPHNHKGQVR
jgi:hypothetical protein